MSAIGIDLGGQSIKACEWRSNENNFIGTGPEIVPSDRAQRTYPARISFKNLISNVCDQRSTNVVMNLRNYIWGFKSVLGSNDFYDKSTSEKVTPVNTARSQFSVSYRDTSYSVDAEAALSIILQYVYYRCFKTESMTYDTFPFELQTIREGMKPVAISIPSYYRDSNVRGVELALTLNEFGQAAFIPEGVAIALDYGYMKAINHQFPSEGKVVLFCDMGQIATTVTIVHFTNNGMHILASRSEMLGGNDFDAVLMELLYARAVEVMGEFDRSESINFKLKQVAERVKMDLSADGADDATYCFELIAGDDEIEGEITKEDMMTACCGNKENNLFDRFYDFVFSVVSEYAPNVNIDVIEIAGGGMRIPQLRTKLLEAVQHNGKDVERVSTTLNTSEACARGTCLFAQKYLVEKEIGIASQPIRLMIGEKEMCSMEVYGYKGDVDGEYPFTITSDEIMMEGVDHDWDAIQKDSKELLEAFMENNREFYNRQEASHGLETAIRELQNLITNSASEAKLKEQCDQDQMYLREIDAWITQARQPHPVNEYETRTQELRKRAERYHSEVTIQSNTICQGGKKYKGTYINGKRMGWFHRYSANEVLEAYGEYLDDKRHGKMTTYYPSGAVKATMTFKDDILHGTYRGYYENGQLADMREYEHGETTGYRQLYYDNGQLQFEGMAEKGIPIFQNFYYRNGMIRHHAIFSTNGRYAQVMEFDREGNLTRQGKMHGDHFVGDLLLFYRNLYYAVVRVVDNNIVVKNKIVPQKEYKRSTLDQQFAKEKKLSRSLIPWREIPTDEVAMPSGTQLEATFNRKNYLLACSEYKTEYDVLKAQAGPNGAIPMIVNGEKKFLSKMEAIKMELYNSNIQEYVHKEYSLSGDILAMVKIDENGLVESKSFYAIGMDSSQEGVADNARTRRVEKIVKGKANGLCVEYYNNGIVKKSGEKKDGQWISSQLFFNTGKPKPE